MLLGLLAVVRVLPAKKQPAVYLGVQRLHASPEHFRPTGKVGNIAHRDTVFAQKLGRSSGRKSFDSQRREDRKSTRLNSSHITISYAVFCLKKKTTTPRLISIVARPCSIC